jgi:hypothetical protein
MTALLLFALGLVCYLALGAAWVYVAEKYTTHGTHPLDLALWPISLVLSSFSILYSLVLSSFSILYSLITDPIKDRRRKASRKGFEEAMARLETKQQGPYS